MAEESAVGGAEVVEGALGIGGREETVLGTAAVADEAPVTVEALIWKTVALGTPEVTLSLAVEEGGNGIVIDVAQPVFGEYKMVAGVEVTISLYDGCMSTGFSHGTDAGRLTDPAGEGGIEELDEDFAYIVAHPFIEDCADEMSILV